MKLAILVFCLASLAGCATGPALDPSLPIGPPSMFNADPDRYDQKQIYVRGVLWTSGHWWQFNFYDKHRKHVDHPCLNLENIDWLSKYRVAMNHRHVILKGKFTKDVWKDALGGCDYSDNGIFLDEGFLKQHYRYLVR